MAKKFYYAVKKGHKPGIYESWEECSNQVKGFKDAEYKKFDNREDALDFLDGLVEQDNMEMDEQVKKKIIDAEREILRARNEILDAKKKIINTERQILKTEEIILRLKSEGINYLNKIEKEILLKDEEKEYKVIDMFNHKDIYNKDNSEEYKIFEDKDIKKIKDNELVAYVDGSYSESDKTYSYGIVLLSNNNKETYKGVGTDKELAEMRNVSGELEGAVEAMRLAIAKGYKRLYLHYDYKGIEEWALGNWKRNKNGTKRYKEFYDSIKNKLDIIFIKVPAHEGIKYNEEADKLAKEAFLD